METFCWKIEGKSNEFSMKLIDSINFQLSEGIYFTLEIEKGQLGDRS
jgi:hypothetical protein